MSKSKLPEEVLNWIYFADEDYSSAEIMLREKIFNKVCFLSQQAAEKILKAFILNHSGEVKRTHKIVDIIAQITEFDKDFKTLEENAKVLDRFYIPTRYPDAIIGSLPEGLPKKEHAEEAIKTSREIVSFVKGKMGI